jgi:hypothetical protein
MSWDVGDSGELIGNIIGVVLDIDAPPTGAAWGKSLRVRVSLDLVQPLQRGQMVSLEEVADGEPLWVAFQYERLPTFMYCCGCIGHGDRECHRWDYHQHGFPYGQWLRAPPAGRLPAAKASGSSPSSTTEGSTAHPPENPGVPFQDASRLSPHVSQHDAPLIPNSSPKFDFQELSNMETEVVGLEF